MVSRASKWPPPGSGRIGPARVPTPRRTGVAGFRPSGSPCRRCSAILFGKPELRIFGPEPVRQATLDHLGRVAELAAALGARALVFGSPRNRDRGVLTPDEAFTHAVDFFRGAGSDLLRSRYLALHRTAP